MTTKKAALITARYDRLKYIRDYGPCRPADLASVFGVSVNIACRWCRTNAEAGLLVPDKRDGLRYELDPKVVL